MVKTIWWSNPKKNVLACLVINCGNPLWIDCEVRAYHTMARSPTPGGRTPTRHFHVRTHTHVHFTCIHTNSYYVYIYTYTVWYTWKPTCTHYKSTPHVSVHIMVNPTHVSAVRTRRARHTRHTRPCNSDYSPANQIAPTYVMVHLLFSQRRWRYNVGSK